MTVRVEKSGSVTTVIHDRPEARNAMDPESADALVQAFLAFDADPDASVAVLYGEGGAFCAGWDRLRDDLVRLLHLAHAHQVTRPDVAVRFGRHFEIVLLVAGVGIRAADVEIDAAAAQAWAGQAPVDRVFRGNVRRRPACASEKSCCRSAACETHRPLWESRPETACTRRSKPGRQIHHQAADAEIRRRQSAA